MQDNLSMQHTGILAERNKVLRNTYMLLGVSLIPTVLGALVGLTFNIPLPGGWMGLLLFMGIAFGFMYAIEKNNTSSTGVVLLLAFTFFMGLWMSRLLGYVMSYSNGSQLIMLAAGGTAAIFMGMSAIAASIKRDISWMGKFLFIGLIVGLVMAVGAIVFQMPVLMLAMTAFFLVLFSVYLMYDLNQIMQGHQTNYISATLAVYIDIYNIFTSLLSLLGIFGGE